MLVSKITEKDLSVETVDKLLFQGLEDAGETVDCILVLGSGKASRYRVPVAVEVFKASRAKKIMLCGGKMRDFTDGACTEAEHMRRTCLALGVKEEDLILENSSQNTVENILYAMIELQRNFWLNHVHKVLQVTTAYHMRRSLAIARYLLPAHITVLPCPADDTSTRRDQWMNTPVGVGRAKGEAMKIVQYIHNAVIPDFEI